MVYRGPEILIVGKVKIKDAPSGSKDIPIQWLLPGGGILDCDRSEIDVIKRELHEETGSTSFRIVQELDDKICFQFPPEIRESSGFLGQETIIFLVEYIGIGDDLIPIDDEIDRVEFVTKENLFERIFVKEMREYLEERLSNLIQA
ncbi:MAG: NUDIX domain-containing protein [Candidatus Lokiarchaeota archaeon]|nr:NUDIX domain-containing protein [Candidatus Lokiarchaeota archaeon]